MKAAINNQKAESLKQLNGKEKHGGEISAIIQASAKA